MCIRDRSRHSHVVAKPNAARQMEVWRDARKVFSADLTTLQQTWDEVSWRIARLRDNPAGADAEHAAAGKADDPGLHVHLTFTPEAPFVSTGARPKVAILREQGVNSHVEMSYAMSLGGFDSFDVHMSDLQSGAGDDGCQCGQHLAAIIPGADAWPRFTRNQSEQFEARLSMVEVLELSLIHI